MGHKIIEVSADTAGHTYGQHVLKFLDYITSPANPNRIAYRAVMRGYVKGHSGNASDFVSLLIDACLKKCSGNLVCFDDVMKWITKNSKVTVRTLDRFLDIPKMLDTADIYHDLTKVRDDIGVFRPRNLKPIRMEFNYSEVDGKWVKNSTFYKHRYHVLRLNKNPLN